MCNNDVTRSRLYYAVAIFIDSSRRGDDFRDKATVIPRKRSRYVFMNKAQPEAATKGGDESVAFRSSGENGTPVAGFIHHRRYNWESLHSRIYILAVAAAGTQSSRLYTRPANERQAEVIHFRVISGSPRLLCPRRDATNFSSISAAAISTRPTKLLRLSAYISRGP